MSCDWIRPDWPAPAAVRACVTTRKGGVSQAPYDSLNLGDHVDDDPAAVARNRQLLRRDLALPSEPLWLQQVHGCEVAGFTASQSRCADASIAARPGDVCVVLTADCLPLLFCDRSSTRVAAVHAGWRGLAGGVIEATIDALALPGEDLLCWLGPAIGADVFEVGGEVREAFVRQDIAAESAFRPSPAGRWLADIYALARLRLAACDVGFVGGGGYCTYSDVERFYSYRRDGRTGRMASLIWVESD